MEVRPLFHRIGPPSEEQEASPVLEADTQSLLGLGGVAISGAAAAAKSLQSCLTLCIPIDGSLPGSPVPGILQARMLEWVAIPFSKK